MLFQILGTLERLATVIALVWLKRDMNADVRRNVITLHSRGSATVPLASQVQVVGAFATNVALANVLL
jgi:hypothetical protein